MEERFFQGVGPEQLKGEASLAGTGKTVGIRVRVEGGGEYQLWAELALDVHSTSKSVGYNLFALGIIVLGTRPPCPLQSMTDIPN